MPEITRTALIRGRQLALTGSSFIRRDTPAGADAGVITISGAGGTTVDGTRSGLLQVHGIQSPGGWAGIVAAIIDGAGSFRVRSYAGTDLFTVTPTGVATFASAVNIPQLNVTGRVTAGELVSNGGTWVGGALTVGGAATVNGGATINGGLNSTGNTSLNVLYLGSTVYAQNNLIYRPQFRWYSTSRIDVVRDGNNNLVLNHEQANAFHLNPLGHVAGVYHANWPANPQKGAVELWIYQDGNAYQIGLPTGPHRYCPGGVLTGTITIGTMGGRYTCITFHSWDGGANVFVFLVGKDL